MDEIEIGERDIWVEARAATKTKMNGKCLSVPIEKLLSTRSQAEKAAKKGTFVIIIEDQVIVSLWPETVSEGHYFEHMTGYANLQQNWKSCIYHQKCPVPKGTIRDKSQKDFDIK